MEHTTPDPSRHHERILVIDFGSQVTQLIARRLREDGIYCEIHPFNLVDAAFLADYGPKGIILSGGPASTRIETSPRATEEVFTFGVPILGICYGEQTIVAQLGGEVETADHREFGRAEVEVVESSPLFQGLWAKGGKYPVWMSHGDRVVELPEGFHPIAITPSAPYAAIADEARSVYGVQFHPEVVHTLDGARLLSNFTRNICGCHGDWTMAAFREEMTAKIRDQVGDGRVICGLSGGVDSAVAAVLIHEAIGSQLTCVFVDTGLMRAGEAEEVVSLFRGHYNIPLVHVEAEDLFLGKLDGVEDPERKRKIIGGTFIDVFEEEARKIGGADFLAQGTLYPDVIESVSFDGGPSVTIKSHHNVGGLPERMNMKLVEPLRELFKDEVRALGRELGLPEAFVGRHPFPGPGLAIRIPGAVSKEKADILRKADAIYLDQIRKEGLYDEIWQAFAVLLPVRTVGVMGDERTYDWVLALRAVTSTDGMTADSYAFSHDFLSRTATRIINEVRGINRVTYDVTSKPPGTIEWEQAGEQFWELKTMRMMIFALTGILTACATTAPGPSVELKPETAWVAANDGWAEEAEAVYAEATTYVLEAAAGLPPKGWAVVLDLDETVINNVAYQIAREELGEGYTPESWYEWTQEEAATLVPGVAGFLAAVNEAGGHVAFVTNRSDKEQLATENNLAALGFKRGEDFRVLMTRARPDGVSAKDARYDLVPALLAVQGYPDVEIIAYLGDNKGDKPASPGDWEFFCIDQGAMYGDPCAAVPGPGR